MAVQFENFAYTYWKSGKPYFVPNGRGERIGRDIKRQVEEAYTFDPFVYHLQAGGHVAALHCHRPNAHFAKADIQNFFYSIARNRVQRTLASIGIARARHYAKWSCIKNPYLDPSYALPYGFVQSPILATLVLMESPVGAVLRELQKEGHVTMSLYMDDIALSSNDLEAVTNSFERVLAGLAAANFELSPNKVRPPTTVLDLFNCNIRTDRTEVRQERIDKFYAELRSLEAIIAFDRYCDSVKAGNA